MPRFLRIIVLAVALVASLALLYPRLGAARLPGNHQGYAPEQPIPYSHRLHAGELAIPCLYCHFAAEQGRYAGIPPANVCMNCHSSVAATMSQKFTARDDLKQPADAARKAYEKALADEVAPEELARLEAEAKKTQKALDDHNPTTLLSPAIQILYDHVGFDPKEMKYDPALPKKPIRWKRVHRIPDFVYFDHRAHVKKGVDCQTCHGPIETMERVRQHSTLWMGWCVNCHREAQHKGVKGLPASPSLDCSACHY